jgi:hypothetical protein
VIIRKHKRTAAEQEAAVVQALKKIRGTATVLARVRSSNKKRWYEIKLGLNNVVYCECPDFQFRHTGNCKHIDKWRKAAVAIDIE